MRLISNRGFYTENQFDLKGSMKETASLIEDSIYLTNKWKYNRGLLTHIDRPFIGVKTKTGYMMRVYTSYWASTRAIIQLKMDETSNKIIVESGIERTSKIPMYIIAVLTLFFLTTIFASIIAESGFMGVLTSTLIMVPISIIIFLSFRFFKRIYERETEWAFGVLNDIIVNKKSKRHAKYDKLMGL